MRIRGLLPAAVLLALSVPPLPAGAQTASGGRLPTRWDSQVSTTDPLPDYPRPQMTRARWRNLNGLWNYGLTDSTATAPPADAEGKILVPFPYEAPLSGVGKASPVTRRLWYQRAFTVPSAWAGQRILLHFGAINWDSTISVNGRGMGAHKGGYTGIDYDITDVLKPGTNMLVVSAFNPMTADKPNAQVIGKQRAKSGSIFYSGATGIWQSVWLEPVPAAHISGLKITPDIDAKALRLTVSADGTPGARVSVTATDGAATVARVTGTVGTEITVPIPGPRLWSPTDPHLYGLRVSLGGRRGDSVDSYFAMRKVSLGKDAQGRTRIFLNNKFVFQVGALDQGYWPDGIYTAPTDAALRYDIQMAKSLGLNLLRKHAKVEPDRWYYWTDKLGMLVWQDMPQAFGDLNDAAKAQWLAEWQSEIAQFYNHPSIIVWTAFNEGWGQHDTEQIVSLTKRLDPTRLINNASGWTDKGVGDLRDTHAYPGPWSELPEMARAAVNGEFGGVTQGVDGHTLFQGKVVGYGTTLSSGWKTTKRYQELIKNAYGIEESRGTSAVVYTQLTDVEQELNGLLTYDRAITKIDPAIVAAADQGRFLPLPPDPHPNTDLVATSADDPHVWFYVTAKPAEDWTQPGFDASTWKSGPAPFGHGADNVNTAWIDTPGDIWLRRTVTLPADIPAKLVVLARHDEDVEVYLNGVLAASEAGYNGDYVKLPMSGAARATLHSGPNLIAVHCRQTTGGQVIDVGIARP